MLLWNLSINHFHYSQRYCANIVQSTMTSSIIVKCTARLYISNLLHKWSVSNIHCIWSVSDTSHWFYNQFSVYNIHCKVQFTLHLATVQSTLPALAIKYGGNSPSAVPAPCVYVTVWVTQCQQTMKVPPTHMKASTLTLLMTVQNVTG